MIKHYSWNDINSLAVKQIGKYCCYVSNNLNYDDEDIHILDFITSEIKKLDLNDEQIQYLLSNLGDGLFSFNSEEEMEKFYSIFTQELTDSSAVYACTYDKDGQCLTENT